MNIKKLVFLFLLMSSIEVFSQTYKKNDKVEIDYSGTWYPGYILEVKDNKYKIHYDAYDNSWDEWVETSRLKPIIANPTTATTPAPAAPAAPATTTTNTVVEEPKQVEKKTPDAPVQAKQSSNIASPSSTTSIQSKKTYYSFTRDGAPITTYECESSPKELWAHIAIPAEAFEYDKLVFEIWWVFKNGRPNRERPGFWEYDITKCESLKKDSLLHILLLDPNNTKDQYIRSFGNAIYVENHPKGKPLYKGSSLVDYYNLCIREIINSYLQCALSGTKITGTKQVWETKYTDGSGEGWWETRNVYGPVKIFDDLENSDELLVKCKAK